MSNNNIKKHFPIFQRLYTKFYFISFYLLNIWMLFGREVTLTQQQHPIAGPKPSHVQTSHSCVRERARKTAEVTETHPRITESIRIQGKKSIDRFHLAYATDLPTIIQYLNSKCINNLCSREFNVFVRMDFHITNHLYLSYLL